MFAYGILSIEVALIYTFMRDLKTCFGGTRIANNNVLISAGITHLPVPSTSMTDPSMILKQRSDV